MAMVFRKKIPLESEWKLTARITLKFVSIFKKFGSLPKNFAHLLRISLEKFTTLSYCR